MKERANGHIMCIVNHAISCTVYCLTSNVETKQIKTMSRNNSKRINIAVYTGYRTHLLKRSFHDLLLF